MIGLRPRLPLEVEDFLGMVDSFLPNFGCRLCGLTPHEGVAADVRADGVRNQAAELGRVESFRLSSHRAGMAGVRTHVGGRAMTAAGACSFPDRFGNPCLVLGYSFG